MLKTNIFGEHYQANKQGVLTYNSDDEDTLFETSKAFVLFTQPGSQDKHL